MLRLLQYHFPYFIEKEATAKRTRAQIRTGELSMVKGVGW
jgi:hypothetical protein